MKHTASNSEQTQKNDKKISFVSNREHLTKESSSCPVSTIKTMPKWYKDADIFAIDPNTGKPWINPQDDGKVPTWKACPALFDAMSTGYVLRTPCDIEFYYENLKKGNDRLRIRGSKITPEDDKFSFRIRAKVLDNKYSDFIDHRDPMPQFVTPMGYDENHFAWWVDWATCVPEGYSVLYTQPMNRFDLPFLSTSGIVDNDKVNMPGLLPFFIFKGWTGIVPAGTPYSQLIPFKRENWESNIVIEDSIKIPQKNFANWLKYRVKNGGVYKNKVWEKRNYK